MDIGLKRLTLKAAEKIARSKNPKLWDSLSPKERRDVVAELNAHLEAEAKRKKALADAEAFIRRQMRGLRR